jgi:hypothetical protein
MLELTLASPDSFYEADYVEKDESGNEKGSIKFTMRLIPVDDYYTLENRLIAHQNNLLMGKRGDDKLFPDLLKKCVVGWDGPTKKGEPVEFKTDRLKWLPREPRDFLIDDILKKNFASLTKKTVPLGETQEGEPGKN